MLFAGMANGLTRIVGSLAKPNDSNKMMIFILTLWKGLRETCDTENGLQG